MLISEVAHLNSSVPGSLQCSVSFSRHRWRRRGAEDGEEAGLQCRWGVGYSGNFLEVRHASPRGVMGKKRDTWSGLTP